MEHGQLHALLGGVAFQRGTQIREVGVAQHLVGLLIVKQSHLVRNDDALGLGTVPQLLAGLDDRAARLLAHRQRRVAVEQTRYRGLRVSRALRDFLDGRHHLSVRLRLRSTLVKPLLNQHATSSNVFL